ncbi:hypothetical protein ABT236_38525 [Streptomyces sp. NPDC001523]|uniref:hypothetical protein n=1 Tax=Streptomyces sp. NPDC001523 TaxID=3154383 RepID=UPI00332A4C07
MRGIKGRGVRRALVAVLVAGVAVACGPAETGGPAGSPSVIRSSAPVAPTSAPPTSAPTAASSLSAVVTPAPSRVVLPKATPAAGTPDAKAPTAPAAEASTKAPAKAPTRPPSKAPTKAPPEPAAADCEIVSNAGNCYNAGQFCRKADVGRSTHAGNGRLIHCRQDGKQPRWQY